MCGGRTRPQPPWLSIGQCGQEAYESCADKSALVACERSYGGNTTIEGLRWAHASGASWAFSGAPSGATDRFRVCHSRAPLGAYENSLLGFWLGALRTQPFGPSVEALWAYGTTKRVRGVSIWVGWCNANAATEAFGGAPYGATKRVRGVPKYVVKRHANAASWAFGRAPYGATKRVRGVPKCGGYAMRAAPLGPYVELPMGPRNV